MRELVGLVLCLIVISALAVITVRHQHRLTYVAWQAAQQQRDRLNNEWGQLLLEQGTFSLHHFVEKTARQRLGMAVPEPEQIVVLPYQR